jgi:UDP-glucose 4-epimerase
MKIMVTGATGYIGAHLVKALSDHGHKIIATDYNNYGNDIEPYVHHFIDWDIRDPLNCEDYYDAVVHLAAATKVHQSVIAPYNYYKTNVEGTKNVIDHATTEHFIYCSTGSAFNPSSSPYAATKYGGELVTKEYSDLYSYDYSLVRFYNVSGNNGFQKYDNEVSHLIRRAARVANSALQKRNDPEYISLSIYGTDYDTRDGTCVRNYTHINDIVNGILNVLQNPATNDVVCLGSPKGFTVREVIDTMKKVSGVDFEVVEEYRRDGDIAVSTVPIQSPFFEQKHSLEDMCRDALKHEVFYD